MNPDTLSPVVQYAMKQGNLSSTPPLSPTQSPQESASLSPVVQYAMQQKNNPDDVVSATKDAGDQSFNNLCEAFVEQQAYGKTGLYPSAVAAWNSYVQKGQAQNIQSAKPGDLIYFSPNKGNQDFGHAGIISGVDPQGNLQFVSATSNGVQNHDLTDWQNQTGQQVLGTVPINPPQQ